MTELRASPPRSMVLAYVLASTRVALSTWWVWMGAAIATVFGTGLAHAQPTGLYGALMWWYAAFIMDVLHRPPETIVPMPPRAVRLAVFARTLVVLLLMMPVVSVLLATLQTVLPNWVSSPVLVFLGLGETALCSPNGILDVPTAPWLQGGGLVLLCMLPGIAATHNRQSVIPFTSTFPAVVFGLAGATPDLPNTLLFSSLLTPVSLLTSWFKPWKPDPVGRADETGPPTETLAVAPPVLTAADALKSGVHTALDGLKVHRWEKLDYLYLCLFPALTLLQSQSPAWTLLAIPGSVFLVWFIKCFTKAAGVSLNDNFSKTMSFLPVPNHLLILSLVVSSAAPMLVVLPWVWTGNLSPGPTFGCWVAGVAHGAFALIPRRGIQLVRMAIMWWGILECTATVVPEMTEGWPVIPIRMALLASVVIIGSRRWR